MADQENRLREDDDDWDRESTKLHQPRSNRTIVTSVRFKHQEFQEIVEAAENIDMRPSEYIRVASLDKARADEGFFIGLSGTSDVSFSGAMTSSYATFGASIRQLELQDTWEI